MLPLLRSIEQLLQLLPEGTQWTPPIGQLPLPKFDHPMLIALLECAHKRHGGGSGSGGGGGSGGGALSTAAESDGLAGSASLVDGYPTDGPAPSSGHLSVNTAAPIASHITEDAADKRKREREEKRMQAASKKATSTHKGNLPF